MKSDDLTKPLFDAPCPACGFKLRDRIKSLPVSDLVLYNDSRFRGRCILALREHYDSWEMVPPELLSTFVQDSQKVVRAIKQATHCKRVNIAVLGNKVAHIHMHLIPRFPSEEADPDRAPWRDQRPQVPMTAEMTKQMIAMIEESL